MITRFSVYLGLFAWAAVCLGALGRTHPLLALMGLGVAAVAASKLHGRI